MQKTCILWFLLQALQCQAVPVVIADYNPADTVAYINVGSGISYAAAFTTGATSLSLTSVTLPLTYFSFLSPPGNAGAAGLSFALYSNRDFTNPEVPLTVLTGLNRTGPITDFLDPGSTTFVPNAALTLAANTTYWVAVLSVGTQNQYTWGSSAATGMSATTGNPANGWSPVTAGLQIRVIGDDGTVASVPELAPAVAWTPLLWTLGLLAARKRRATTGEPG